MHTSGIGTFQLKLTMYESEGTNVFVHAVVYLIIDLVTHNLLQKVHMFGK